MILPRPPLLVITDRLSATADIADVVSAALDGGCRWIMVREKDLDTGQLAALAADIVRLAGTYGAMVLVNGDARAARESGAAGVHLPRGRSVAEAREVAGADAVVGVSAHTRRAVATAHRDGADYATCSPVFETRTKPGYGPALGLDGLAEIARAVPLPVVALGGITAETAAACVGAGATGVAVLGAVMRARDPRAAVESLVRSIALS